MIKANGLTKVYKYNKIEALKNIDLHIKAGEIHGLVGPNGAGKTTFIRILTTLSRPTRGEVFINGFNLLKESKKIRKISGCVFQETVIEETFTGYENLYMYGRYYKIKRHELKERIKLLSDLLELDKSLYNKAKTYSGGMKRKLDIGVALINQPKILFLDEPTLGLAPNIRIKLWEHILKTNKEFNTTIFMATHYLDEADNICNRISIINDGQIVKTENPKKLKKEIEGDVVKIIFDKKNLNQLLQSKDKLIKELKLNENIKNIHFVNDSIFVYCKNIEIDLVNIIKIINNNDLNPSSFITQTPSLEDVFLKYTGNLFMKNQLKEA